MAATGRYLAAMGVGTDHAVWTELTPDGFLKWSVSKGPAVAGGMWAQWVYEWAAKKWANVKRGPEFAGGVCVIVGAFGMQVMVTRLQPSSSHMVDKLTDGMVGRISPVVVRLFKGLFPEVKRVETAAATPLAPALAPVRAQGLELANASLDGDREAVIDVAKLLRDSPETTDLMAQQLFAAMKTEGHEVDEAARLGLVSSFRQVAKKLAEGQFQ